MIIELLRLSGIRSIKSAEMEPDSGFNLLIGGNGSGKTSVLEAIYALSSGHSFRTRKPKELISHDADEYTFLCKCSDPESRQKHQIGLSRTRGGDLAVRVDFQPVNSIAEVSRLLPVKVIHPDSHSLVQEGPAFRRQFLDWGGFHVKHEFFSAWKAYRRALSQRNLSLRLQHPRNEVEAWNRDLIQYGSQLSQTRHEYVEMLKGEIPGIMDRFGLTTPISIHYQPGWSEELDMATALAQSWDRCVKFRTTTVGPHRAEMSIKAQDKPARQVLSRGEQKLIVYGLHFAQLQHYNHTSENKALMLLDDLSAELDQQHASLVLEVLQAMDLQCFITGNQPISLPSGASHKLFHVEHGRVLPVV